MAPRVVFQEVATSPEQHLLLPRSGASAATLPPWHTEDVIMVGGYTEEPLVPGAPPKRGPTNEVWTFHSANGGSWRKVEFPEGSPMPQPRMAAQAAVVGDHLWLVGGWNPAAAAVPGADPQSQFLNDVWRLDLRTGTWQEVTPQGEAMPRISRFAMVPLPGGKLLLHTHRSLEDVLLLDTAGDCTLSKVPVSGVFPGSQSPASRGLQSLTAAAAPAPGAAVGADMAVDAAHVLYVYGGAPQSGPMHGDLWALNTGTWTWQELKPQGAVPEERCSHVAGAAGPGGRYLLVIGGARYEAAGLVPRDDVILYDTQANAWVVPEVKGPRPRARNASVMVPLRQAGAHGAGSSSSSSGSYTDTNTFVFHAGWNPFKETYNDTYLVTVHTD